MAEEQDIQAAPPAEEAPADRPKRHGRLVGTVEAISGAKSIRVVIDRLVRHEQYGKFLRRRTRLVVHDPEQVATKGDLVEIQECRPISKTKRWKLVQVVRVIDNPLEAAPAAKGG